MNKQRGRFSFILLYVDYMFIACQDDAVYNRVVNTLKMYFKLITLGNARNNFGILI